MPDFPVDSLREPLFESLKKGLGNFVISAPTGSGKSTRLPCMFADFLSENQNRQKDEKANRPKKVLVLQPRRVAARMLAKGVCKLFDMRERSDVGWHVRFDKNYDDTAKIVFLTEGILARTMLGGSSLNDVGAIIFDEFHERNIFSDITLALAMRLKEKSRPDLLIAVCSASMDSSAIAEYFSKNCTVLECSSRAFPVEIEYAPPKGGFLDLPRSAAKEFERLSSLPHSPQGGNFLIFMPGVYEIGKTISEILKLPASRGFQVSALHGELPARAQDEVLALSHKRKVIVATNIAETSLTIEGVDVVIDSGLARVARYDAERGVNTLLTERESIASAVQRAGRAGRLCAGKAVRLWRKSDEENFVTYNSSEIARVDLSQTLLWLKSAGMDFSSLKLFENPPENSLSRAEENLKNLDAIHGGKISKMGRLMGRLPTEPRIARLLIEGALRGCVQEACLVAAMDEFGKIEDALSNAFAEREKDEMLGKANSEIERFVKICLLARSQNFSESFCREFGIRANVARRAFYLAADFLRVIESSKNFAKELEDIKVPEDSSDLPESLAKCVLAAFSDHLGVRLNLGTLACRFVENRRGELRKESAVGVENLFVALELREQKNAVGNVAIMASRTIPIRAEFLSEMFPDDFSSSYETVFDSNTKSIVALECVKFRDLIISEKQSGSFDKAKAAAILRDDILSGKLVLKSYDDDAKEFITRVNFAAKFYPESEISPIDDEAISSIFEQMCFDCSSYSDVKKKDVKSSLRDWLSPMQVSLLKTLTPTHIQVNPKRRPIKIKYDASTNRALVSALFKDFYYFNPDSLSICAGRVKPTFELLSPGGKPVQTTQDLKNFWTTSWLNVKKELKARYPKHFKPEDPY